MTSRLAYYERKAEILKALGHPIRLCIVNGLLARECNVTGIKNSLQLPQSTISQHLGILKAKKIIKGERKGLKITYSVVDDDVAQLVQSFTKKEVPFK